MLGLAARILPYFLAFFGSLCLMVLELVASRLVARHVGLSLIVWTSVIGVMLGGVCLGNVLGGRLADRVDPRRTIGPLYVLAAGLTIGCLWVNAFIGYLPGLDLLAWDLRTLVVITLEYLVPATVLGMISPIVAKIAVEEAKRAGSALGDVYFLGAFGSIIGTFLAGFYLIYLAPTSVIVTLVASALVVPGALLTRSALVKFLGLLGGVLLVLGAGEPIFGVLAAPSVPIGPLKANALEALGHLSVIASAVSALMYLIRLRQPGASTELEPGQEKMEQPLEGSKVRLGDLAVLSFIASLVFMALEMVAGRLVTRHLGSSVFGWTSVIGVLLGGLSLGNYLGGKIADFIKTEKQASHLFLIASVLLVYILIAEHPPSWLVRNPIGWLFLGESPVPLVRDGDVFLRQAITWTGHPWWFRVLFWTSVVFLVPSLALGTVSPVVAKLAVDRHRQQHRTGSAIGMVYAWGMVGSILGTFLTGFVLIDWLGTKGVLIVLSATMALAATVLGSLGHAAWAGVPLGLCVLAFLPGFLPDVGPLRAVRQTLSQQGLDWGLRDPVGDPDTEDGDLAYVDESNYYYIKVENENTAEGQKRTLVLDNLIHGYEFLGQPRKLDYSYEHIYALVTDRVMRARHEQAEGKPIDLRVLFLGGGSYTFPRYLQATYPRVRAEVAEIDPAVTHANHVALGLPWPDRSLPEPHLDKDGNDVVTIQGETIVLGPHGSPEATAAYLQALRRIAPSYRKDEKTGEAASVIDGKIVHFGPYGSVESAKKYLEAIRKHRLESPYVIHTTWGDARRYVVNHQDKQFQIVYGDAFNDFSVPWHLTTREFNDRLNHTLSPDGVYMINIIDEYESDTHAAEEGPYRSMADSIEKAIQSRWSGHTSAQKLSEDLADVVPGLEWTSLLADVSRSAARALEADQRPKTRAELRDDIRLRVVHEPVARDAGSLGASRAVDPRAEPFRDRAEMQSSAEAVIANARAQDVLLALDEARAHLRQRFASDLENPVLVTSLRVLDATRGAAYPEDSADARLKMLDATLDRAVRMARTVSRTKPQNLFSELERLRGEIDAEVPSGLTDTQGLALSRLLEGIVQIAGAETRKGSEMIGTMLGLENASKAAERIADRLQAVRDEVHDRARSILADARNDEALAADVAGIVHRFTQDRSAWLDAITDSVLRARHLGGFLGAWIETARKTFPHVKVFGTASEPGEGDRETFVVVVSRQPLDLENLGGREDDLEFFEDFVVSSPNKGDLEVFKDGLRHVSRAYSDYHMKALAIRSRGIILTDDYAPVENLLAPVAETRGDE